MAKKQHCLMCGGVLFEMTPLGEPADGRWPPLKEDPEYGTVLVCPECDAVHLTVLDARIPDQPPVRRVRCLKPRD